MLLCFHVFMLRVHREFVELNVMCHGSRS